MEFLVGFEVKVPHGAPTDEVEDREIAEASAAARLAEDVQPGARAAEFAETPTAGPAGPPGERR